MRLSLPRPVLHASFVSFLLFTSVAFAYATQWWLADPQAGAWGTRLRTAIVDWWIWSALAIVVFDGVRRAPLDGRRRIPLYAAALALLMVGQIGLLAGAEQLSGIAGEGTFADTFQRLLRKKIAINLLIAAGLVAAGHLRSSAAPSDPQPAAAHDPRPSTTIAVRRGDAIVLVPAADVRWAEAAGNYVVLHTAGGHEIVRLPLHALLGRLGTGAVRISRSTLVRIDQIAAIEQPTRQGDAMLRLRCGTRVRLTRTFRKALLERLPDAS